MAEIGEIELTSYLSSNGIGTHRASGAEVTAHCWFCPDGNPKQHGRLYLNTDTWLWDCKRCGTKGNRKVLLKFFGDTDLVTYAPVEDPLLKRKVLARAVEIAQEGLHNNDEMLDYLVGRGLSAETIERYQLGYVGRNTSLCKLITLPGHDKIALSVFVAAGLMTAKGQEWLDGHITIPYHSHGQVVAVRAKDPKAKYFTAAGDEVRLFNVDALAGADEVVITEGEFDCLVLQQAFTDAASYGRAVPAVVAIPGAQALPANFEKNFVDARRVFAALDPDEEGNRATEHIIKLIGAKACPVSLPDELPKCDWCADEQTEVLTRRGWLTHDEFEVGDEVWALDPATGMASWAMSAGVFRESRQRTMVHLEAETHDSLTTPDHRWITERGFVLTKDLKNSDRLIAAAPSTLPVECKYDDDLVELVAWYYTEGSARSAGISIAQAEPKAQRIRTLLTRMYGPSFLTGVYSPRGVPTWKERVRSWGVVEFDLNGAAARAVMDAAPEKIPSAWFLSVLTAEQLDLFIDTSVDGDGWRRGQERYFSQAHEGRRDAFVMACTIRGLATRTSQRAPGGYGSKPQWVVNVLQRTVVRVASLVRTEVQYDGVIWCPSVPGRSTWMARRNGKTYFTGNTEYLRHKADDHPHGGHDWRDVMRLIDTARMATRKLHGIREMSMKWEGAKERGAGVPLGFPEFDAVIGGLQPGQLCVPAAKSGTAKTVLLANIVNNTAHRRTLLVSLEMQSAEFYNILRRVHFFFHAGSSAGAIQEDYNLLRCYDENQITQESMLRLVEEYTDDVGAPPELILLDYLGYYARGIRASSPYERTSEAVMSLKGLAKSSDAPMVVPAQVNRGASDGNAFENEDMRDSGVIEETADFLVKFHRPARSKELRNTPDISGDLLGEMGKSRHGYQGKVFRFRMSNMSLAIVEASDTRNVHRVEQENAMFARGVKYEEFRRVAGATQLSLVGTAS